MVPYEAPPQGGLEADGGSSAYFEIDFPSRSHITKVLVEQTGGTAVNFDVDLYNRQAAVAGSDMSDTDEPFTGELSPELFRIYSTLSGVAGSLAFYADRPIIFYNHDGEQRVNTRKLYVKITPAGSGKKTFSLLIGGLVDFNG